MVAKRPARPALSAAKRQKLDPVLGKCSQVLDGITESKAVPKVVQRMLRDMLEGSLGVPQEERHKFQANVVSMVGEVLVDVEAHMQEEVKTNTEACAEAEGEKAKGDAAVEEAEKQVAALEAKAASAKIALADDAKAVKVADQAILDAEANQLLVEKEFKKAEQAKATLTSAMQDFATPLVEGRAEDEEAVRGMVIKLMHMLKGFGLDQSMITAIPEALSKKPSERGPFDTMVVQQLNDEVSKRLEAFDGTLQASEQTRTSNAAAVDSAKASQTSAKQGRLASATAFLAAQAAHRESEEGLEAARAAFRRTAKQVQRQTDALEHLKARLAAFREGPLAAFAELRDREAPKPAEEEPGEAKEAAEEAEAPQPAAA